MNLELIVIEAWIIRKDAFPIGQFDADNIETAMRIFREAFASKHPTLTRIQGQVAFFDSPSTNTYQVYPKRLEEDACS